MLLPFDLQYQDKLDQPLIDNANPESKKEKMVEEVCHNLVNSLEAMETAEAPCSDSYIDFKREYSNMYTSYAIDEKYTAHLKDNENVLLDIGSYQKGISLDSLREQASNLIEVLNNMLDKSDRSSLNIVIADFYLELSATNTRIQNLIEQSDESINQIVYPENFEHPTSSPLHAAIGKLGEAEQTYKQKYAEFVESMTQLLHNLGFDKDSIANIIKAKFPNDIRTRNLT